VCNISYLLNNELQETTGIAKLSFVSFFIQTNVFSDDFRAKNYCEKYQLKEVHIHPTENCNKHFG